MALSGRLKDNQKGDLQATGAAIEPKRRSDQGLELCVNTREIC